MGGRKTGRETSVCARNHHWLPLGRPQLGTWPASQACALTGSQTGDVLVLCSPVLNPTEPHQPGFAGIFACFVHCYNFSA